MTDEINEKLDFLCQCESQITKLMIVLQEANKNTEAKKAQIAAKTISEIIRQLSERALKDWADAADALRGDIEGLNAKLKSHIATIENEINMAGNIAKALSVVDQIIGKLGSTFSIVDA